jgi:hypothetical protein
MSQTTKREPYEPPAVLRVRFASGELAVGACKKTAISGSPNCYVGGINQGPRVGS